MSKLKAERAISTELAISDEDDSFSMSTVQVSDVIANNCFSNRSPPIVPPFSPGS
jgi:hypothetical protein